MIDYIHAEIKCPHKPFGKIVRYIDRETGEVNDYSQKLDLKNETANIRVKSLNDGTLLSISGNPLSFLQQHNLFGSNNLLGLVYEVFKKVTSILGIEVDELTAQDVRVGNYELYRVDSAFNFRMPNNNLVKKVVREIGWCWFEQNKNVSTYPDQTAYLNQHSEFWTLKFYAKYQQMISSGMTYPSKEKLLEYASAIVRGELTLRRPELIDRKLNLGSDWAGISLPKKLLIEAIDQSGLTGDVKLRLVPDEVEELSAALKRIYIAWTHGESIRELYGQANYYRIVAEFGQLGIDVSLPPHKKRARQVKLMDLIVEENIATFPRYARNKGLIFIPEKLRV